MKLRIKRLLVRLFIRFVKTGAVFTYYLKRTARLFKTPLTKVARFVVRTIGVPVYRGVFFVRRLLARVYIPGKHKLMYVMTNRYTVHVVVILIAFSTMTMSVQASGLRSEDFGQDSILYGIVSEQGAAETIVVRSDVVTGAPTSYLSNSALSIEPDIDFIGYEDTIATVSGGSAIIAPTISESSESVAPRTEVIEYTIESGDTVSTIAQKHGISITTLLWANDLSARSVIRPGDTLTILPVDGILHTVKSGDSIIALARTYDAESDEIVDYNHMGSTSDLRIGETLLIPGGVKPAPQPIARAPVTQVFTKPTTTTTTTTTSVSTAPAGAATGSGSMVWPTDLRVITQYYGWSHTGVDIDCHFTNDNYAADDGYVQFAGWKGGYGLAVEINHGNGIVTRYGHGAKNYVSAGQTVTKGQPIQLCGTTGRSTGTHLHFEVMVNGRFTNPLEYTR